MSFRAFNHTVNILAYKKLNKSYVATYAWFTQVGYEEVMGLLGSQSVTANMLEVGDIVGLSACSKEMKDYAAFVGDTHSDVTHKLAGQKFDCEDTCITFPNAKVTMKLQVKQILHLEGIESDHLVYFKVLEYKENDDKDFLLMSDYE